MLFEKIPSLHKQIVESGRCKSLLELWGQSRNVDDNTGERIVDDVILKMIGELTGVSMIHPVVHAGIEHTYGYLLSNVETPYGKKRERWTDELLEAAWGCRCRHLLQSPIEEHCYRT